MATTTWTKGTITLTNGSATVTGDGTEWDLAELEGGETLAVVTDPPIDFSMTIQAVVGAEEITLTAPWAGATLAGVPYQITRDYTGAPADAPIPQRGDMNPWAIMGEAFRRLNNAIASFSPAWGSITGTLSDQTDLQSALDAKLDDPGSNGIAVRTGADGESVARTLTGTANQVIVTNGDGVSGNPTLSLPQDVHAGATPTFAGVALTSGIIEVPEVLVEDDNVLFLPFEGRQGRMDLMISGGSGSAFRCSGTFSFRTLTTMFCRKVAVDQGITDPFETSTGALSPGDGSDGKVTISPADAPQGVYVSNRSGQSIRVSALFMRMP